MSWLRNFFLSRAAIADMQRDVGLLLGFQRRTTHQLNRMENLMADVSPVLNDVAEKIRALASPVSELLAENTRLRSERDAAVEAASAAGAEAASLRAEDDAESAAAANVTDGYNELAAVLSGNPDAPGVEPLPAPADRAPADGAPVDEPPTDEPTPAA